jgi:hypothetical protein
MKIALVHTHYSQKHLKEVKDETQVMGSPTIKAVWLECYCMWAALEGCHRIRAAADLGLPITIQEYEYSDVEALQVMDPNLGLDIDNNELTVGELIADTYSGTVIDVAVF